MMLTLMSICGSLIKDNIVQIYMDDLASAVSTCSEVISKLEAIFKTLKVNNITCQATKTRLAFPSIQFLGFSILKDGLKITDDKIRILKSLRPPKDNESLQKILGIINFFQSFCHLCTKSTYHMRALLRKDAIFIWSEDCQKRI